MGFYLPILLPPVIPNGPGRENVTQVNRNEREAGLGWISVVCLTQRPFHIELHCIVVGNNFLSQELKGGKKKSGSSGCAKLSLSTKGALSHIHWL